MFGVIGKKVANLLMLMTFILLTFQMLLPGVQSMNYLLMWLSRWQMLLFNINARLVNTRLLFNINARLVNTRLLFNINARLLIIAGQLHMQLVSAGQPRMQM